MKARLYLSYARLALRIINAGMPWEQHKLRKKGSQFVLNYSDEGDARLMVTSGLTILARIVLPQVEEGGHKADVVPVIDRHYEYAYTVARFREYDIRNKDILDVGSSGSVLPAILAALGNRVVCIDVREWPVTWPNLEFVKGDLLESDIAFGSFDVITCVSTIEHVGLGAYGDREDVDGDIKGMAMLRKYLKPRGRMILSVPFGKPAILYPYHRIYDKSRLSRLTSGFRILDKKFFGPIDSSIVYRPCSEKEAYSANTEVSYAVVCVLLEKERT